MRYAQKVLSPILLVLLRDFEGHLGKLYKYRYLTPKNLFVLLEASKMYYFKGNHQEDIIHFDMPIVLNKIE